MFLASRLQWVSVYRLTFRLRASDTSPSHRKTQTGRAFLDAKSGKDRLITTRRVETEADGCGLSFTSRVISTVSKTSYRPSDTRIISSKFL